MNVTIEDLGYKIKIKNEVIKLMESYRQLKSEDYEAGGMLIGYETKDNNIIIEYATQPYQFDKRTRYRFDRRDKKHNKVLKLLWNKKGNIHIYVGEWHTHPEDYPNYSFQDKRNWFRISKRIEREKFIHVIVGNKAIGVWKYDTYNKKILKIRELYYE